MNVHRINPELVNGDARQIGVGITFLHEQAERLIARLCAGHEAWQAAARARLIKQGIRGVTVAEVYRACASSRPPAGEVACS